MKKYIAPEMDITEFKAEDVITASNSDYSGGGGISDPNNDE